jgi:hypothetical protein
MTATRKRTFVPRSAWTRTQAPRAIIGRSPVLTGTVGPSPTCTSRLRIICASGSRLQASAPRGPRQWLTTGLYAWDTLPEYLDAVASVAEGRTCGPLRDRPLVVLRAGNYGAPPDFPQDIAAAIEQLRQEIHSSFTRLSSHSSYIVAERSAHIVQHDEPELVLDAIRGVVDTLRAGRRDAEDAEE